MMRKISRRVFIYRGAGVLSVVGLTGLVGCGDDDDDDRNGDGGPPEDGGVPEDGGAPEDGGPPEDSGAPEDGSAPEDGGPPEDSGAPEDGGAMVDLCDTTVEETDFHTHSVTVPPADVEAGMEKSYMLTGAGHTHSITLTEEDFAALASGDAVDVDSTNDQGHSHGVTVTCE